MKTRNCMLGLLLLAVLPGNQSFAAESIADRVRNLAAKAQDCVNHSTDARVMAVNALKNALAAEDEAEQAVVRTMSTQAPDSASVKALKKDLEKALEDAKEVMKLVETAIDFAASAQMSAAAALSEAEKVQKNPTDAGASAILDKADDLLASALKSLKKAEAITGELKQAWLLPIVTTTTTTTSTTTTIPPSPTPVGRR